MRTPLSPFHPLVVRGILTTLVMLGLGCAKEQQKKTGPYDNPMQGMPTAGSVSLKVGSLLSPTHFTPVNMSATKYMTPMGGICTCRFDQPKQTIVFGTLKDPQVTRAAKHLQELVGTLNKKEYFPIVILHGGSGAKEQKAAKGWAKKNKLTQVLVGVSIDDQSKKAYGLTDKCTILIVDDIHKLRARFDGFDGTVQKKLDETLKVSKKE